MSNQMKPNTTPSSLYEQLQKNKQQQETEFYEESKPGKHSLTTNVLYIAH